jgi:hypothetical protein
MAGKRAARLKGINDVSAYLARLINKLERNEISESKAGKLGYLCNILKSSLEAGDLEQRIETIEMQLHGETPAPKPKTLMGGR